MSTTDKVKPTILPGFMELLPSDQIVFNRMMKDIQSSFELFGFLPMDTPQIEKAEVLLAKGGGETERQIYTLKKGDNDLALRFDLTVPLARFVSEHFNELNFPFKRYQIGKVYRGEKAQKGRFREFYQCDIDVIGKDTLSLVNDAEILAAIYFVFNKLDLGKFLIKINNRRILSGFIESLQLEQEASKVIGLIDKIEKMDGDRFNQELRELKLNEFQMENLLKLLKLKGSAKEVLDILNKLNLDNELFNSGLKEITEVVGYLNSMGIPEENWVIDLTIARGLEYYTGTVYETFLVDKPYMGSVCGGGRYDNLAEYYTDQKLPGVGISLGLTRMFYQLQQSDALKKGTPTTAKILLIPLEKAEELIFSCATKLRSEGISTEVYTGNSDNLKKKLDYANKTGVPFVGIIGENEIKTLSITIKDMKSGEQETISLENLPDYLKRNFS